MKRLKCIIKLLSSNNFIISLFPSLFSCSSTRKPLSLSWSLDPGHLLHTYCIYKYTGDRFEHIDSSSSNLVLCYKYWNSLSSYSNNKCSLRTKPNEMSCLCLREWKWSFYYCFMHTKYAQPVLLYKTPGMVQTRPMMLFYFNYTTS